jgi:hypothetical protein
MPPLRRSELGHTGFGRCVGVAVATVVFVALTCAYFHGLVFHFEDHNVGKPFTDTTSAWWVYWAMAQGGHSPWTANHLTVVGAPDGLPLATAVQILSPFQPALVWALKPMFGILGALNLVLLTGFIATGATSFAFLWIRLRLAAAAAFFGAVVMTFNPWMVERALIGQVAFIHAWPLIGLIWTLFPVEGSTHDRPQLRAAFAGAFFAVSVWINPYYGLLASVIVVAWLLHDLVFTSPRLSTVRRLGLVAGGVALLLVLPGAIAYFANPPAVSSTFTNELAQIDSLSAKAWAYFVPSHRQVWLKVGLWNRLNPTQASENTLYFGCTTLLLAAAALAYTIILLRRRNGSRVSPIVSFATVLLVVAFLTSLPPSSRLLHLPVATSELIVAVTPYFRVFARVGFLVGLALAMLASYTLSVTIARFRRIGSLLALAALVVVAAELLVGPIRISRPGALSAADRWLVHEPKGIVAYYPTTSPEGSSYDIWGSELLAQIHVRNPLFNTIGAGLQWTVEQLLRYVTRDLTQPSTAAILRSQHVHYVVVDNAAYRALDLPVPSPTPGLKKLAALPGYTIYTPATAAQSGISYLAANASQIASALGWTEPAIQFASGFNGQEPRGRWMIQDGRLSVDNRANYTRRFRIKGRGFSATQPHTLTFSERGRLIATVHINTFDTTFVTPPVYISAGLTSLTLHSTPGPAPLANDGRLASVYIEQISLEPLVDLTRHAE